MPVLVLSPLLGGPAASAASTSPLGSTSSQRGCSRPSAKRTTLNPAGALGAAPAGQWTTSGMPISGIRLVWGAASGGLGPKPTRGSLEPCAAQPAKASAAAIIAAGS